MVDIVPVSEVLEQIRGAQSQAAAGAQGKPFFDVARYEREIRDILHHPVVARVFDLAREIERHPRQATGLIAEGDARLRMTLEVMRGLLNWVGVQNRRMGVEDSPLVVRARTALQFALDDASHDADHVDSV